ncbi:stage III sporulation protein AG [Bacillus spongiae]|uniref:Stage III sporulation protein AG n=1 Tax=Bacillus spongiae TaxID=2683610 RepID=A0ABU8HFS6_9BACI
MSHKNDPFEWLKKTLKTNDERDGGKKLNLKFYVPIILLIGIAFMLISNIWTQGANGDKAEVVTKEEDVDTVETFGTSSKEQPKTIQDYEHQYESKLTKALEEVIGIGEVAVYVNVDATELKVYEKNSNSQQQTTTEVDREGGQRKIEDESRDDQIVIIRDGEKEVPLIVETKKPPIRGVLIIAKGAENVQVKKWIKEAVTSVFNIGSHQVSVMPKQ